MNATLDKNTLDKKAEVEATKTQFYPTFFLGLFLGVFGIHRFYTGKIKSGVVQLLTFGGLGIWWLIDMVMILVGKFKDKNGVVMPNVSPKMTWATFIVAVIIGLASNSHTSETNNNKSETSSETHSTSLKPYEQKYVGVYLCQDPASTLRLDEDKTAGMMINGNSFEGTWRVTFDSSKNNVVEFKPNVGSPSRFTPYTDGSFVETKYGYKFSRLH